MGHAANLAIEMIQVSTKTSSWTQKCVDSSDIFTLRIGQKIKELFQSFEGPGEVKQIIIPILYMVCTTTQSCCTYHIVEIVESYEEVDDEEKWS